MFNNKGGISFIFILVGIISVFYCIKRIYEGDFLLINFSDCGLLFLFLMTSIFIICRPTRSSRFLTIPCSYMCVMVRTVKSWNGSVLSTLQAKN